MALKPKARNKPSEVQIANADALLDRMIVGITLPKPNEDETGEDETGEDETREDPGGSPGAGSSPSYGTGQADSI